MARPWTVHGGSRTVHELSIDIPWWSMVVHGDYHETTVDAKQYQVCRQNKSNMCIVEIYGPIKNSILQIVVLK